MTTTIVHFDVEGKWFTWFLRHLWVEGNELKAVKVWRESFPDRSSPKHIEKIFLPIVSGKKKFTGWASKGGLEVVDDKQKFWDPDQSGKGNEQFPLLRSWEDVLLLKKVKLYIAELELRSMKLNRTTPTTFEGCNHNSLRWIAATEENKIENTFRKEVNDYWIEIRNITLQFGFDARLELLPTDFIPLQTFRKRKDRKTVIQSLGAYRNIMSFLIPVRKYFHKKYGKHLFVFSERKIQEICEWSESVDRAVKDKAFERKFVDDTETASILSSSALSAQAKAMCGTGVNVNQFVHNLIEDSHRDRLKPDDPEKTKWRSGYIDREGKLYTCTDIDHLNFSKELCEHFGFKGKEYREDHQIILDDLGWVKISMNRFSWDRYNQRLTDEQKKTMFDFMSGKKLVKTMFNTSLPSEEKTYSEAMKESEKENF
jgi:hypothetical protein